MVLDETAYGLILLVGLIALVLIYIIEWLNYEKTTWFTRFIQIVLGIILAFASIILILRDLGVV